MFTRSHLEEMKRRYASMYAPPVEEEVIEDGTIEGVDQYKKDTPGQEVDEHKGTKPHKHPHEPDEFPGEDPNAPAEEEEDEIEEGTALQVKMALDDAGLKGKWKNNKVYVKKRDVKKAEKALKGNVIYRGKPPVVVGEEVELDEKVTAYPATVDTLRKIVKDKQHQTVMFKSGQAIVDLFTASAMVQVYDALKKPEMKKYFEKMIGDKAGFLKTQAFAMKMVK